VRGGRRTSSGRVDEAGRRAAVMRSRPPGRSRRRRARLGSARERRTRPRGWVLCAEPRGASHRIDRGVAAFSRNSISVRDAGGSGACTSPLYNPSGDPRELVLILDRTRASLQERETLSSLLGPSP
jgi:hypothetical protein